jgi:hypothetical protein
MTVVSRNSGARANRNPTAHSKIAATARIHRRCLGAFSFESANSFRIRLLFRAKFTCVIN